MDAIVPRCRDCVLWHGRVPHRPNSPDPGGACIPASERAGRRYRLLHPHRIRRSARRTYNQTYPTAAAGRAGGLEAFDKVWLLTVDSGSVHPERYAPRGNRAVPTTVGTSLAAQSWKLFFTPGMKSRVHRHSVPEAWYTLQAAEHTWRRRKFGRPRRRHTSWFPRAADGTDRDRARALVLILHDSSQPHTDHGFRLGARGARGELERWIKQRVTRSRRAHYLCRRLGGDAAAWCLWARAATAALRPGRLRPIPGRRRYA